MNMSRVLLLLAAALLVVGAGTGRAAPAPPLPFTGVNLAGGEFNGPKPGVRTVYGTDFVYPSAAEMDYFAAHGMNVIRLPFQWPVLQPTPTGPLDHTEWRRFQAVVAQATGKGLVVLLDPHDYARYYDKVVGGSDVPDAVFADFWGRLAAAFRGNPRVWFGLMNEPHDMPTVQWRDAANAAIAAIRRAGARNLILVPGNGWTSASGWESSGSGDAMLQIHDPANHYIFEVHTYLDADSSGTKPVVVSPTIGVERLRPFVLWCRRHHRRGFLGEFGAPAGPEGRAAVNAMLMDMERDRDVWVGFTWWAAGAWWGDYMFSIEPKMAPGLPPEDRPQMAYLRPHLQRAAVRKTGRPVSP